MRIQDATVDGSEIRRETSWYENQIHHYLRGVIHVKVVQNFFSHRQYESVFDSRAHSCQVSFAPTHVSSCLSVAGGWSEGFEWNIPRFHDDLLKIQNNFQEVHLNNLGVFWSFQRNFLWKNNFSVRWLRLPTMDPIEIIRSGDLAKRLKSTLVVVEVFRATLLLSTPASSKWPFDSPNGGRLRPEKVTYGSKRGHFEEPGHGKSPWNLALMNTCTCSKVFLGKI